MLDITSISCAGTSLCVAVTATQDPTGNLNYLNLSDHVYTSTNPTSSTWTSAILGGPDGGVGVNGVACPSSTFCVATQGTGTAYTTTTPTASHSVGGGYYVATWTNQQTGNKADVGGISCPSTTLCMAGESKHTGVLIMTGSTHGVRSSAAYGPNDLLSTSSLVVGGATVSSATYSYDTLGQTTASTMTGVPGASGSYSYDAGGDPNKVVDPSNGTSVTQTFNTNQQVVKATPHSTSAASATFTYDSIGARTSEKETGWGSTSNSYSYYQTGELRTVNQHTAGTSASYTYNANGLRIKATETIKTTTHENQTFTWETETKTPELLADGSHYFIYGPTGQIIEQETATLKGALYLIHNALGSVVATISSTHAVSTAIYNAYGSVVGHTGNNTTPIGFAGAYTDSVTGFLYLVHRYYDPTTGEFLSIDPDVGTTHQPYEYANDDPMNLADPSGLDCGGGPTLGAFAAAYGGWQLEELAAAYEGWQLEQFAAAYVAGEQVSLSASMYIPFVFGTGFLVTASASIARGYGSAPTISVDQSGHVTLAENGSSVSMSSTGLEDATLGTPQRGVAVSNHGLSATTSRSGSVDGSSYTLSVTITAEIGSNVPPDVPGSPAAAAAVGLGGLAWLAYVAGGVTCTVGAPEVATACWAGAP